MNESLSDLNVVITGDAIAPEAIAILAGKCRTVFTDPYPAPETLARRTLREEKADAPLIIRTGKATAEVVKASPRLKVIAKQGVGFDNIDVPAATALKIPVSKTGGASSKDHVVLLK